MQIFNFSAKPNQRQQVCEGGCGMNTIEQFLEAIPSMDHHHVLKSSPSSTKSMDAWMTETNMMGQSKEIKKQLAQTLQNAHPNMTVAWYGSARGQGWTFDDINTCLPSSTFIAAMITHHVVHDQSPHTFIWIDLYNQLSEKTSLDYDHLAQEVMQSLIDVLCRMDVAGMARWTELMEHIQDMPSWVNACSKAKPRHLAWEHWADRKVRMTGESYPIKSIFHSSACAPMVKHLINTHSCMRSTVYAMARMEDVTLDGLLTQDEMISEPLCSQQEIQKFQAHGYYEKWGTPLVNKWTSIVQNMTLRSQVAQTSPSLWGRVVHALSPSKKM